MDIALADHYNDSLVSGMFGDTLRPQIIADR